MRLFLNKLFLIFCIIFFIQSSSHAKNIEALYKIEIAGINIGTLNWLITNNNNKYKASITLKDSGFLSGVYKFSGKYISEGDMFNELYVSNKYKQTWRTNKKERVVEIFFIKKKISELIITPKEKELPRIDYMNIDNVLDPISSFMNILFNKNSFMTIDGRRLYKMVVKKNEKDSLVIKKITIENYSNIWTDHNKKDLNYIEFIQNKTGGGGFFPDKIKIKNKGLVFKLTKN